MKQKRIKYKTNKAILSASTSVLVLSTIASAAGSAAQLNEFIISSDRDYVTAGDSVGISVDLLTDSVGVSGFTFDLHYDPAKAVPVIGEDDDSDSNDGFFIMVTPMPENGVVRVVGAYMTGDDLTADLHAADIDFTVLDDADGDLDLWIEVETMIAYDGEDYVNAEYSAPTENSPYTVNILGHQPEETSVPVTQAPETSYETETTSEALTEESTVETTVTEAPFVIVLEDDEPVTQPTEAELPDEIVPQTSQEQSAVESEPVFEYSEAPKGYDLQRPDVAGG